jgi:hypothetical protein
MLPRYSNTNVPHISVSTALINVMSGTNFKTNQFHPAKDSFALDSSEIVAKAVDLFGDNVHSALEMLRNPQVVAHMETLSVNAKSLFLKQLILLHLTNPY